MRYTDIYFFGTILIVLIIITVSLIGGFDISVWVGRAWWIILLPVVVLKVFFKSSGAVKWLEKDRLKPPTEEEVKRKRRKQSIDKILKW